MNRDVDPLRIHNWIGAKQTESKIWKLHMYKDCASDLLFVWFSGKDKSSDATNREAPRILYIPTHRVWTDQEQ